MKLDKIRSLAQEIIHEIDKGNKDPMYGISVSEQNGVVRFTWNSDVDKDFTWLFYLEGVSTREWQNSSAHFRKAPDKTSQLSDEIPIRQEGTWKFKAVVGEWIPEINDGEVLGGKIEREWQSDVFEIKKK